MADTTDDDALVEAIKDAIAAEKPCGRLQYYCKTYPMTCDCCRIARAALAVAVPVVRERCAKVAIDAATMHNDPDDDYELGAHNVAAGIAAAIRAQEGEG